MKKIMFTFVAVLATLMIVPHSLNAQEKKKEKKKKEVKWEWDGKKSGNETFDSYLMACDSLWTKIQGYQESTTMYAYKEDTLTVDGKIYLIAHMEDTNKNLLSKGMANWQFVETASNSLIIGLNATQISMQTASATMALPSLGFNALSFGKYIKAGPQIVAMAVNEVKDLASMRRAQMRRWNDMRKKAVDPTVLKLSLDEKGLDNFKKCYFAKELKEEDTEYQEIKTVMEQKSQEQLDKDAANVCQDMANGTVLPEDKSKSLDNISEDEFTKAANA